MSAPSPDAATTADPPVAQAAADDLDLALEVFLAQRTRLFRIAYQILGDVSGAGDVVQEVWLRWQLTHRASIRNPSAFLTTVTTRLAINVVKSACHRHEKPAEPLLVDLGGSAADDPGLLAEQAVAVEAALALLMARLTPLGLAAFILRKGFGYAYADVAGVLRISVPNARVVVHRAQARLRCDREQPVPAASHRRLVTAFRTAASTGDMEGLLRLLAPGGTVRTLPSATPRPILQTLPSLAGSRQAA